MNLWKNPVILFFIVWGVVSFCVISYGVITSDVWVR